MPRLLLAALVALFTLPAVAENEVFEIEGRMVEVISPERLELLPAPLVILLHGARRNSGYMADSIPLERIANTGGFRAVYVDGSRLTKVTGDVWKAWNVGYCCGTAAGQQVDDLGTIDRIIERFENAGLVAPGRIYLVGHSNGAMMSYHYACNRPGRVAGVIGLAGNYVAASCPGADGLRVLAIHGEQDDVITIDYNRSPVLGALGAINSGLDTFSQFMREEGAWMSVLRLPNAGHPLDSIEVNVAREMGIGLNTVVGRFVANEPLFDVPLERRELERFDNLFEGEGATIAPVQVTPLE